MTVTTLSFRELIDQLVRQQFFIEPNIITDRTYTLQFEVEGSDLILNHFADFLFDHSKDLFGTDPSHYLAVLIRTGKKLSINPVDKLKTRFKEKIGSFIKEGLATETILFIATISSILEILDYSHYQTLLKELSSLYYHQCISLLATQEYEGAMRERSSASTGGSSALKAIHTGRAYRAFSRCRLPTDSTGCIMGVIDLPATDVLDRS